MKSTLSGLCLAYRKLKYGRKLLLTTLPGDILVDLNANIRVHRLQVSQTNLSGGDLDLSMTHTVTYYSNKRHIFLCNALKQKTDIFSKVRGFYKIPLNQNEPGENKTSMLFKILYSK